ncbi:cyclin-dependent protein kinase inhibitor SMR6 [Phalaenopsis equestris]|uniref:cyclin-dependent protein kinase inhibitor SMR6 n=1 Tax=Phalaenopsis equestris TaxID=78828 RepID=UPI0009E1CD4B|nr:cyclin-dependent protein kinase inhibitor SMR6 [Phalaenopsis equestris]
MASKPKASAMAVTETEELPPLQPVLMKAADESEDKENEMVTPKSENCILKQPTVCPPAPRKREPARRKREPARRKPLAELSPNRFYTVPQDLSSAFMKRSNSSPPKKRIRLL